jgi:hypothetical protein
MLVQTPTCHLTLNRDDPGKPWAVDLTAGFVPADGIVHCETWVTTSREELRDLLAALGVNGIQLSPRETTGGEAHGLTLPASTDTVLAQVGGASGPLELSLVVLGCTGPEMAGRIEAVRLVAV